MTPFVPGDPFALECVCGNTPWKLGFVSCTPDGHLINESEDAGQNPFFRCDQCGAILDARTGQVVGGTK